MNRRYGVIELDGLHVVDGLLLAFVYFQVAYQDFRMFYYVLPAFDVVQDLFQAYLLLVFLFVHDFQSSHVVPELEVVAEHDLVEVIVVRNRQRIQVQELLQVHYFGDVGYS